MTRPPDLTIVFDTDCVLCSGLVHFVLRHEAGPTTRFLSAWSPEGLALAARHGLSRADLQTSFLAVEGAQGFTRSAAALRITRHLRQPWRSLTLLRFVPAPLRDALYRLIARNRYRWFGQQPNCFLPPPDQRDRFL